MSAVAVGAEAIVRLACIRPVGPTGGFFDLQRHHSVVTGGRVTRRVGAGISVLLIFSLAGFAWNRLNDLDHTVGEYDSEMTNAILSIGLHPSAVDYSKYPGIDEAMLTARIEAGEAALGAAGFDFISCQVPADPDDAEARLRDCANSGGPFRIAMIGAGVRMAPEHTALFERLINVINEISPGITFCFNTTPDSTIDALRRVAGRTIPE